MQSANEIPLSPTARRRKFDESREKFVRLSRNAQLIGTINEFYQVQEKFHENMGNLVKAFDEVRKRVSLQRAELILNLLEPYRVLIRNPFRKPTGNIESDLKHILCVIDKQNIQFSKTFKAILDSISTIETFKLILKELESDQALVELIKDKSNFKYWADVSTTIDLPRVNFMRYELLLTALLNVLEKEFPGLRDSPSTTETNLQNLIESDKQSDLKAEAKSEQKQQPHTIDNIPFSDLMSLKNEELLDAHNLEQLVTIFNQQKKNISIFNRNLENFTLLNKIDRTLVDLLIKFMLHHQETESHSGILEEDNEADRIFEDKKKLITVALQSVSAGKNRIMQGNQDVTSLYAGIRDFLISIESEMKTPSTDEQQKVSITISKKLAEPLASLSILIKEIQSKITESEELEYKTYKAQERAKLQTDIKNLIRCSMLTGTIIETIDLSLLQTKANCNVFATVSTKQTETIEAKIESHKTAVHESNKIEEVVPMIKTQYRDLSSDNNAPDDFAESLKTLEKLRGILTDLLVEEITHHQKVRREYLTVEQHQKEDQIYQDRNKLIFLTIQSIASGTANIKKGIQDINSLFLGIYQLLNDIEATYSSNVPATKSFFKKAVSYVSDGTTSMFSYLGVTGLFKEEKLTPSYKVKNPRAELHEMVNDMRKTLEQVQDLQAIVYKKQMS